MASIKIVLRDKQNKEGLYPIILRITKDRSAKIISLGMDCEQQNWDEKSSQFKKSMPNHIQKNLILSNLKQKAWLIIDQFNIDEVDFTHAHGGTQNVRAIVAGWINGVRLIDNMPMGIRA